MEDKEYTELGHGRTRLHPYLLNCQSLNQGLHLRTHALSVVLSHQVAIDSRVQEVGHVVCPGIIMDVPRVEAWHTAHGTLWSLIAERGPNAPPAVSYSVPYSSAWAPWDPDGGAK